MNIKFLVSMIIYLLYIMLISKKSFHMLQQNKYNAKGTYIKWILKNKKKVFLNESIFFFIVVLGIFSNNVLVVMTIFIIYYVVISLILINKNKKEQVKLPLKYTARVKRLLVTTFLIYIIPILIIFLTFKESYIIFYYLILGLIAYLNYIYILLANLINKPIEKLVGLYFKKKAIKKLKSMNGLNVIGITGSYGKTSSKNILNDILNIKYNALQTPKNYNTPFGLMITINNYLDKFTNYFIAEMGACNVGDIKELCDFVHPKYGIITKIGIAHLESFGSQENIIKTKFELIESLPNDGIGILNGDDELQLSYKIKNNCKTVWIGIDNKDVDYYATNIKLTYKGTSFDCIFKGNKNKYRFETKLLGKANIYNILAGIALGHELGISIEQLQMGVKKVNSVEHRLELKKYRNINIIDDAYNSNPVGSKMAIDVLSLMPGKHIVVTPGMIEMGSIENQINKEFGNYIASNKIDSVILVGEEKTKPIYDGLIEKKYNKKNIYIINDVMEAFNLIEKLQDKETYVLLENDLPDIFNER